MLNKEDPLKPAKLHGLNPFKTYVFEKYGNKSIFLSGVGTISLGGNIMFPGLVKGAL
jgi:hypothetical protein